MNLKILFVTMNLPIPVRAGSAQRTSLIIDALRQFGTVDLFTLEAEWAKASLEEQGYSVAGNARINDFPLFNFFDRMGRKPARSLKAIAQALFSESLRYRALEVVAADLQRVFSEGKYDLVVGRYLGPSSRAGVHSLSPAIIDVDDLDSQKIRSWIDSLPFNTALKFVTTPFLFHMEKVERRILNGVKRIWVPAVEDRQTISLSQVDVIPNIPFFPGEPLGPSPERGSILFVGSLDYRVNVNAISRFLAHSWINLLRYDPALKLRIVGGGLDASVKTRWEKVQGVELAGFVADLKDEYRRASFSIIPIWEGGGTKIKLLESFSFQRTCVVATPSIRGYTNFFKNQESLLIANSEKEFENCILELHGNVSQRAALEDRGCQIVSEFFTASVLKKNIRESVELVMGYKGQSKKKAVKP